MSYSNELSNADARQLEKYNALLAASAGFRHLLILANEAPDYATWSIDDYKTAYDQYME